MESIPIQNWARKDRRLILGICVFLGAITWIVFGQTLGHEFVWDDHYYVVDNSEVTKGLTLHGVAWAFTHVHSYNWHPLTTISHMLDCQFYGLKPGGHHCTNVVLHTLGVVLLFLVLRKMTGALWRSAFVAAVFAIHPLRVESVAWVAERKDLLSGVFFMLTLAAYLRYVRKPSFASYLLVAFVFALGLMSKPMMVTLPFVLLLLDYWPLCRFTAQASATNNAKSLYWWDRRSIPQKLMLEKIPLLVLSAISCGATLLAQEHALNPEVPLLFRVYNAFVSCISYIRQMFWPARLAIFYPFPVGSISVWALVFATALLGAILFGVTLSAWALRKRRPYIITGWLWYLGMLVPVIGLVQVGSQAKADRYTYLPQIGLYLAATWAMMDLSASWRYRRKILSALAIAGIVLLIWRAWIQTFYWKNSESIWTRTLAVTSNNYFAHEQLGLALSQRGQLDDAISHYQESLKISPDFVRGRGKSDNARKHFNLGNAFFEKGLMDEAMSHYQIALELGPEFAEAHSGFARALFQHGDIDQAIAHWQKTLSIHPEDADAHTGLGAALLQKGQLEDAIAHYEKAVELRPDYANGHYNLADALLQQRKIEAAIREYAKVISIQPKNADAHTSLANTLVRKGELREAIDHYETSLQIAPGSDTTLNNLAWLLSTCPEASLRNGARAIELAEKADQLSGRKNPTVIRTVAAAYAETGRFNDAIETAERALQLAVAQGDPALAGKLQMEIDLYRTGLPRRDRGLAPQPTDKS
jgi:tetratricopeptide (TPR) repeat protein